MSLTIQSSPLGLCINEKSQNLIDVTSLDLFLEGFVGIKIFGVYIGCK